MAPMNVDVLVVGAGPAGCMTAIAAARAGLKTILIEANEAATTGRTCCCDVENTVFTDCGLEAPTAEEVAYHAKGVNVISPSGAPAFTLSDPPVFAIKLGKFVQRLLRQAKQVGVDIRYGTKATAPLIEGERVVGVAVRGEKGRLQRLEAKVTVDATGQGAALVRQLPARLGIDFSDRFSDQIFAENRLYTIDRKKAKAAAAAGKFVPEFLHHQLAIQGCFSIRSFLVSLESGVAWFLVGIKDENAPPRAPEVLDKLVGEFDFLRERNYRGASAIRLRRASLRLVTNGFVVIGEAAGMVIPAHASGVASGLRAGKALGEHLGKILHGDGQATTETLWPWSAEYQRNRGAILASYDVSRRQLELLDPNTEVETMMRSGLMQPDDLRTQASALPLRMNPRTLPKRLLGIPRCMSAAIKYLAATPKMTVTEKHWNNYPAAWDPTVFAAWKKTAEKLLP